MYTAAQEHYCMLDIVQQELGKFVGVLTKVEMEVHSNLVYCSSNHFLITNLGLIISHLIYSLDTSYLAQVLFVQDYSAMYMSLATT